MENTLNSILNGVKYIGRKAGHMLAVPAAAFAIDSAVADYAFAQSQEEQGQSVQVDAKRTYINDKGEQCTGVVVESCVAAQEKPKPAPKPKPEPKGKPKGKPKAAPETNHCYHGRVQTSGDKPHSVDMAKGMGGLGKCKVATVTLEPNTQYLLTLDGSNEYFESIKASKADALNIIYEDVNDNSKITGYVFEAGNSLESITMTLHNNVGKTETNILKVKIKEKEEAKAPEPEKKERIIPTEKPAEKKEEKKAVEEESWLAENADITAIGSIDYANSSISSTSNLNYQGFQANAVLAPSFKLGENVKLIPFGRYANTNFSSGDVQEHEWGVGALLEIYTESDSDSRLGGMKIVFGGNNVQQRQSIDSSGFKIDSGADGGEAHAAVEMPGVLYPDSELSVGINLSGDLQLVKAYQDGLFTDLKNAFKAEGDLTFTYDESLRMNAGWGASSMYSLESASNSNEIGSANNSFGSHLRVGFEALSDEGNSLRYGLNGKMFYGVDNDSWGATGFVGNKYFEVALNGERRTVKVPKGNNQEKIFETTYLGAKLGVSTDLDRLIMQSLGKLRF